LVRRVIWSMMRLYMMNSGFTARLPPDFVQTIVPRYCWNIPFRRFGQKTPIATIARVEVKPGQHRRCW
jgi:hypothetical protein